MNVLPLTNAIQAFSVLQFSETNVNLVIKFHLSFTSPDLLEPNTFGNVSCWCVGGRTNMTQHAKHVSDILDKSSKGAKL